MPSSSLSRSTRFAPSTPSVSAFPSTASGIPSSSLSRSLSFGIRPRRSQQAPRRRRRCRPRHGPPTPTPDVSLHRRRYRASAEPKSASAASSDVSPRRSSRVVQTGSTKPPGRTPKCRDSRRVFPHRKRRDTAVRGDLERRTRRGGARTCSSFFGATHVSSAVDCEIKWLCFDVQVVGTLGMQESTQAAARGDGLEHAHSPQIVGQPADSLRLPGAAVVSYPETSASFSQQRRPSAPLPDTVRGSGPRWSSEFLL